MNAHAVTKTSVITEIKARARQATPIAPASLDTTQEYGFRKNVEADHNPDLSHQPTWPKRGICSLDHTTLIVLSTAAPTCRVWLSSRVPRHQMESTPNDGISLDGGSSTSGRINRIRYKYLETLRSRRIEVSDASGRPVDRWPRCPVAHWPLLTRWHWRLYPGDTGIYLAMDAAAVEWSMVETTARRSDTTVDLTSEPARQGLIEITPNTLDVAIRIAPQ